MTLLILSLFALSEETKTYEIEFEPVIIIGKKEIKEYKDISQTSCFFTCYLLRSNFYDRD